MAFSEQSLADARQQGYSDDEIFDHIAKSDERFSVAKQQGYSLDDIASHLKQKEGGVNYEDATSQSGQGPRDNRNEQAVSGEVQASNQVGVQADSMLPAEDQSQFRSDDQARVTTGIAQGGELIEGQTKDAQGRIQGKEDGQGLPSQVSTGNEAQVIAPQQAAMQAAPFGAEGVQSVPAKSFVQGAFESIRDFGAETFSNIGQSIYGSMAGIVRTEPEYIDLPSLGAKVKNPRFEEQQKLVNYFEGLKKESAEAPEVMGAKPLEGIPKVAAEVTGGLLKLPAQVGTGLIGFTSLIGEAYGSAKEGFYQKAKEKGMSDDEAVKDSESKAIATTAAALPIYYIAGKGAGAISDKVVSEATPKIVDAALRVGLNTVANAIGSATIRGVTAALDGEDVEKAVKDVTVPGLIQDFAFASHSAVTYFKEQAAKGNGKEAARDLPDPVLDRVAQDPRYAGIVAPEVAARAETRVAQQAKVENLPETAKVLEVTTEAGRELAPTELPREPIVTEKAPTTTEEPKGKWYSSDELKQWDEEKTRLYDEWQSLPMGSEERTQAREKYRNHTSNKPKGQIVDLDNPQIAYENSAGNTQSTSGDNVKSAIYTGKQGTSPRGLPTEEVEFADGTRGWVEVGVQPEPILQLLEENTKKKPSPTPPLAPKEAAPSLPKEEAQPPVSVAGEAPVVEPTAEAPAEAQPTKPSESQAPAAEAAKPTAVKIEEGVAPREGEGESGQVAPLAAEAVKEEVAAPSAPQAEPTFIQKAESWADSVIKEASKRVSTGLDPEVLAAYALKGSIVIGRGVRNFGVWSGEMVKQFGEEIRPHLKDIWSRAKSYAEDEAKIQMDTKDYIQRREEAVAGGGPTVMRGVSERLAEQAGEGTAEEYYIQADELVRRKSLSDAVVMEWVNSLTPEQAKIEYEKAIFAPASDEIAAIKGKLAARRAADLSAAGDKAGYARVVNEIGREATLGSYVLRDLQFLYKATPEGFTMLLEKVAEKKNIKIKPEKIAEIEGQFKNFTEAGKLSEAKELEVINAQSEAEFNAALKDLEKLRKEGLKKQNALDKSVGGIWPKSGREELIPSLLKSNFLTTMSVATNLAQNVLRGTFLDVPQKLIQGKYSQAESLLTGKEPKYTFGLEQAVMYYATLAKESPELVRNIFRTALRQPLPADKPVNIMEIRSSLNPMAALKRLRGLYNKDNLQYEGDYGFKEAIKDSLEATTGVTGNIMFDLLTTTDRPFRQAFMISESSGMARRLGLKGLDYEKFVKLPQRGIEKWARENIKDPAKRAEEIKNLKQELDDAVSAGLGESEVTIAGKNVTRGVSTFLKNIAKWNPLSSLLVYANAPYVRFPLNFAVTSFKLANPEAAMVSFGINAARGNSKKAAVDFSVMATGVVLAFAGKYLYDQGVIQTTDSPQTKAQRLSGEIGRAGSINLSKLKRIKNGESSDTMPGDNIQRLDRLGLIGVALLNEADKQEALKKKKLLTGEVSFADALITRMAQLPVSLSYSLNQTFTKGVAGIVDALTQGEQKWEKLFKNTFSASLSLVAPNELSAISRYVSDYTPNIDDPKFMKTLENSVRQRFGMTGDLPVKRGFWGEKVASTPEGANPIAYHFFDFTKQRKLPSVPATMEIIRLFEKTQDNRIIPAEVQDKITIKGTSYRLSAKDHERYQELVGGERLNRVNKLIDTPSYQSASVDRKADRYAKAIDRGARMGERKFLQELQKSGREAGEVLKIPRKELIRRISELENED
jgi:hypothetical protein